MIQQKDDSFFQLSLTELAFVLVFIVLLLIGAKFVLVDSDTAKCQSALGACTTRAAACEKSNNECQLAFKRRNDDPDAIIDTLVRAPALAKENAELRQKNEQLDAEVKALDELKKKTPDPVRAKAAEDFLSGYERDSRTSVTPKDARKRGEEAATLRKELENCRGQLTHCNRLVSGPKGFGKPPCWTDSDGNIQHLLEVEIRSGGLAVAKAWPEERNADAEKLPGLQATLDAGLQSLEQFTSNTQGVFAISTKSNPECRHYAIIRKEESVRDLNYFNRLRLGIQVHFYPNDKTGITSR